MKKKLRIELCTYANTLMEAKSGCKDILQFLRKRYKSLVLYVTDRIILSHVLQLLQDITSKIYTQSDELWFIDVIKMIDFVKKL